MDRVHYYPLGMDEQGTSLGILRRLRVHLRGVAVGMFDSSIDAEGVGF